MTRAPLSMSLEQARRIALNAQGFTRGCRAAPPSPASISELLRRLGVLQIDSVNVLVRSHYLPAWSRLGHYEQAMLDRLAYEPKRTLFEYWGHEASLLPIELQPLLRWRMDRASRGEGIWRGIATVGREHPEFCAEVLNEIRTRGPLGVSDLGKGGRRSKGWWGWSHGKVALEWLFWSGAITTHSRRRFERIYDLTDRVLPRRIVAAPTPDVAEAQRQLLRISMRALGVATLRDLRDYFRLPLADTKARIAELVESGDLQPATVEGWKQAAYIGAMPDSAPVGDVRSLLSPFDSLIWERNRTERLFAFRYRLEIYTPARRREHGYYVLPLLLGDRLVARVDLKSDRARSALRVQRAHLEPGIDAGDVVEPLRAELALLARWLGLERVVLSRQRAVRQLLG